MDNIWWIVLVSLVAISFWIKSATVASSIDRIQNRRRQIKQHLLNVAHSNINKSVTADKDLFTNIFIPADGANGVGIDTENKELYIGINESYYQAMNSNFLINNKDNKIKCIIVPFKDVVSVELIQDDISLTKTDRGSQIGGAVIGGVLLGGVGAVIGGLSGSNKTTKLVSKLLVRIVIDNHEYPIVDLNLLYDSDFETTLTNKVKQYAISDDYYITARAAADKVMAVITTIIRNESYCNYQLMQNSDKQPNLIDELERLSVLVEKGFLSKDEYEARKKLLIN